LSQVRRLRGSRSPGTGKTYSLSLLLDVYEIPRSTYYDQIKEPKEASQTPAKRGPKTEHTDDKVVEKIKEVLDESPFSGEGHRKVRVRLKLKGIHAGKTRVLRLMKENNLLAPTRKKREATKREHKGKIITERPNECWGGDITEVMTVEDGKVSIFDIMDHCTDELLAIHVVKRANRFEAIECLQQATRKEFGEAKKDAGRGVTLRLDHGSQFTSERYVNEAHFMGFEISYAFVGQPQCNGIIERWHRTLKEQLLWTKTWKNIDEVRGAVKAFVKTYNSQWLIERHGHRSPLDFRRSMKTKVAA